VKEGSIPQDWKSMWYCQSTKAKATVWSVDRTEAMKVVERIFEHRIRLQIEIDDMQFGFMKVKGNTDAIFMARHMQENFRVKGKKLYFHFVDLEKAFDRVPREVISWELKNG